MRNLSKETADLRAELIDLLKDVDFIEHCLVNAQAEKWQAIALKNLNSAYRQMQLFSEIAQMKAQQAEQGGEQ
ncbi:hypothetical protein [Caviibacterium pharyngocola]|uniref:Uncharacterized protein n=1 Tax=Caviibacterium pharyngocola TaxID=28159 RepID=A0A2M8RSW0_9PAST|nr:hypothetical protein [Caviibacterium pharyngocola]PJG81970.1 hypothetical protein CVP04_11355 [Caviibacterium pharyngocola]